MAEDVIEKYGQRVGYTDSEMEKFQEGGHRIRHVKRLSEASSLYSIKAEVVKTRHCNSGHEKGQKIILDVGVECLGYGEVLLKVQVIPRVK